MVRETTRWRPGPQRWALGAALLLIAIPLTLVFTRMHRDALFPANDQRFDVTRVWIAAAQDLCPGMASEPLTASVEDCLATLSLDDEQRPGALESMSIPPLPEIPLNTYPDFTDLMLRNGLTRAHAAVLDKRPVAVGFRVPKRLFVENRFHVSPNVLVFANAVDARICYAGACPQFTNHDWYLALQFPLFAPRDKTLPELVDVWIVFLDHRSPWGINLEHGLFIASTAAMKAAGLIHKPFILGTWIVASAMLLGMAFMALLYALLWSDYVDFAAFALLVVMAFLNSLYEIIPYGISTDVLPIEAMRSMRYGLTVQLTLALCFFAASTLRPQARRFWLTWLGVAVGVGLLSVGLNLWVKDYQFWRRGGYLVLSAIQATVPPLIALVGGLWVTSRILRAAGGQVEQRRDGLRRLREQTIMAICLVITALPSLIGDLQRLEGQYTYDLKHAIGLGLIPAMAAMLYGAGGTFRSRAESYRKELVSMTKKAAVGELVQMLAHDVRKPFSLLRMGLDVLTRATSEAEMRRVVDSLAPQVSKSMRSVSAMLEDVMTVSGDPTLAKEQLTVETLVAQCVQDTFQPRPDADVNIRYRFAHGHLLDIDAAKILRVMTNITENAMQATGGRCDLWFETSEQVRRGQVWIDLVIGNSKSFIADSVRDKIFDAFFTAGKANGTGLGLAVAKKFVTLHGGNIVCRSSRESGTEFVLSLPAAGARMGGAEAWTLPLAKHSSDVADSVERAKGIVIAAMKDPLKPQEVIARDRTLVTVHTLGRPLRVLLVDDEPIYAAALAALLDPVANSESATSRGNVEVLTAVSAAEARELLRGGHADLGIFDVDIGDDQIDGIELSRRLKSQGRVGTTCIHSNRSLPSDLKRALEAGADHTLPKPMARSDMLNILHIAAERAMSESRQDGGIDASQAAGEAVVVVVDDDPFVRESWTLALTPAKVLTFASGEEAVAWADTLDEAPQGLACVVLDFHLGGDFDGISLAQALKPRLEAPILLSSDGEIGSYEGTAIAAVIPKEPVDLRVLMSYVPVGGRDRVAS